jgi:hypothetical protein
VSSFRRIIWICFVAQSGARRLRIRASELSDGLNDSDQLIDDEGCHFLLPRPLPGEGHEASVSVDQQNGRSMLLDIAMLKGLMLR